jgi:hypothetical protein
MMKALLQCSLIFWILAICVVVTSHKLQKLTGSFAKALAGLAVPSEWVQGTAKSSLRTVSVAFCTL